MCARRLLLDAEALVELVNDEAVKNMKYHYLLTLHLEVDTRTSSKYHSRAFLFYRTMGFANILLKFLQAKQPIGPQNHISSFATQPSTLFHTSPTSPGLVERIYYILGATSAAELSDGSKR